jgi:hypothetical protein
VKVSVVIAMLACVLSALFVVVGTMMSAYADGCCAWLAVFGAVGMLAAAVVAVVATVSKRFNAW